MSPQGFPVRRGQQRHGIVRERSSWGEECLPFSEGSIRMREEIRLGNAALAQNDMETANSTFNTCWTRAARLCRSRLRGTACGRFRPSKRRSALRHW